MEASFSGYIVNYLRLDELNLSTYNNYYIFRTLAEARQAACEDGFEIWRVLYEFDAEVNADGYLVVNGEGYGPAGDETELNNEDWGYRSAVIEQLSATVWHRCEFVE